MSASEALENRLNAVAVPIELCRHELAFGTCTICKQDDRPSVFITGGGLRYHARSDCPALLDGRRRVEDRGGTTEVIEPVHPGSARLEGRVPCRTCKPV